MGKTVTLQKARPGRSAVQVGKHTFPLGEPVRNVPEDVIERLKAVSGVRVHVAAGTTSSTTPDKPSGGTR